MKRIASAIALCLCTWPLTAQDVPRIQGEVIEVSIVHVRRQQPGASARAVGAAADVMKQTVPFNIPPDKVTPTTSRTSSRCSPTF